MFSAGVRYEMEWQSLSLFRPFSVIATRSFPLSKSSAAPAVHYPECRLRLCPGERKLFWIRQFCEVKWKWNLPLPRSKTVEYERCKFRIQTLRYFLFSYSPSNWHHTARLMNYHWPCSYWVVDGVRTSVMWPTDDVRVQSLAKNSMKDGRKYLTTNGIPGI